MVAQEIIRVREVESGDLTSVSKIAQNSFKDPYSLRLLKNIYNTNPEGFLVAEMGREIVGYLIGLVRWSDVGHILAVAVDESHRREGAGSALMINAIERLKNNGANRVKLEVRASNEAAKNFYSKLGFEAQDIVPGYYSDGEAAISMEYKFE